MNRRNVRRLFFTTLLFCAALMIKPPCFAASSGSDVGYGSIGIGIGTGGLGVDFAYPVFDHLDVRVGYDFGSISGDRTEDDIEYDAKLKFSSARLIADIKPFGGGFRISAGLYTGTPKIDAKARGLDDYDLGDNTYRGDLDIDGEIDLGGAAPYLGLGWGGTAGTTGFGVSFDLGVLFAKSPKAHLDVSGYACDAGQNDDCDPSPDADGFDVNGTTPQAAQFRADRDAEIDELEDDAKSYDLWPILRLGLHYRF